MKVFRFRKNKRSWWILSFLIFIFAISLLVISFKIDSEGNYNHYGNFFRIDANNSYEEKMNVLDYTLNYDFEKEKGNISWWFNYDNWTLEEIVVEVQGKVKKDSLETYIITENNRKINLESEVVSMKESRIFITDSGTHGKERFFIEFETEEGWKPEGRYHIYKEEETKFSEGEINFLLGNKYSCENPCIYSEKNVKESIWSSPKKINLDLTWDENNLNAYFKINTLNKKKLFLKNVFLTIGVSLLVSILITWLSILYPKKKQP